VAQDGRGVVAGCLAAAALIFLSAVVWGILTGQLINYPGAGTKSCGSGVFLLRRLHRPPLPPLPRPRLRGTRRGHFPSTKRTVTQDDFSVPDSGAAFRISGRLWAVVTRAGVNDGGGRREDLALGLDARRA
jgi:hypothetical protein